MQWRLFSRYADVLVHRLLLAAVSITQSDWWGGGEAQTEAKSRLMSNTSLQELCVHINTRNRAAQRAQRDSQTLFQTLYFKDRPLSDPRCVVDAVIFSLKENGFLVYIPQYALKVLFLLNVFILLRRVYIFFSGPCVPGK